MQYIDNATVHWTKSLLSVIGRMSGDAKAVP